MRSKSFYTIKTRIALSLTLFLSQLFFVLYFAPSPSDSGHYYPISPPSGWHFSSDRYSRLNNWDSFHYFEVIERQYHASTLNFSGDDIEHFRVNGGFFPGYPLLAKIVQGVFTISSETALLVAAHIATFVFWFYYFSLMNLWVIQRSVAVLGALLIWAYPGSFFLVAGYSESLFCASILGFIFWNEVWLSRKSKFSAILAGIHGFIMSATRLFALPVFFYPSLQILCRKNFFRKPTERFFVALAIGIFSSLGAFLFFVWCRVEFGTWRHYMDVQQIGWGNVPDYFAILKPWNYFPWLFYEPTMISINRLAVWANLSLIAYILFLEKPMGQRNRAGLYFAASTMLYLAVTSKANSGLDSLSRYTLPVFVLSILAGTQVLRDRNLFPLPSIQNPFRWKKTRYGIVFAVVFLIFAITHAWIAYRFLHGKWVT